MSTKILALDTSTENCSVALLIGDQCYSRSEVAPREHTHKILPMVDDVLAEAGISLNDVDALAFGRGPGSFTGVRIGIGIAQGLAFGADLPMIGISTLKAMAQATYRKHGQHFAACAIDARMSEVYWGRFQRQDNGNWMAIDEECVISPLHLVEQITVDEGKWRKAGTGWKAYQEAFDALAISVEPSDVLFPEAEDIAYLAKFDLEEGNTVMADQASPVYLRDKVAWKKLPGRE